MIFRFSRGVKTIGKSLCFDKNFSSTFRRPWWFFSFCLKVQSFKLETFNLQRRFTHVQPSCVRPLPGHPGRRQFVHFVYSYGFFPLVQTFVSCCLPAPPALCHCPCSSCVPLFSFHVSAFPVTCVHVTARPVHGFLFRCSGVPVTCFTRLCRYGSGSRFY